MTEASNKIAKKLRLLATSYARAYADMTWLGVYPPKDQKETREIHREARRKLFHEIVRISSLISTEKHEEER